MRSAIRRAAFAAWIVFSMGCSESPDKRQPGPTFLADAAQPCSNEALETWSDGARRYCIERSVSAGHELLALRRGHAYLDHSSVGFRSDSEVLADANVTARICSVLGTDLGTEVPCEALASMPRFGPILSRRMREVPHDPTATDLVRKLGPAKVTGPGR